MTEDISFSDNRHIMGIPFIVAEGFEGRMVIPERDMQLLREISERLGGVLAQAGIDLLVDYGGER